MIGQSTGPPFDPVLPSTFYFVPLNFANSISLLMFNLLPHLPPINEKSPLSGSLPVSDEKCKVRIEAPPTILYNVNLPHPSATTMGTTAGTSLGAPLGIDQLQLEGPARYFGGRKPSVRAWLVKM